MQNPPSVFFINWFLGSIGEPMSRGSASLVKIGRARHGYMDDMSDRTDDLSERTDLAIYMNYNGSE